jgi:lipoprotein LpqB-like beta-propeller protein/sporulation and spore germination protein
MSRRDLGRTPYAVAALLLVALLSGCMSMPEDGPVVETQSDGGVAADQGNYIDPRGPTPGATRADIVRGFLFAMTATPSQTNTAREFLSEDAAVAWRPEDATITYAGNPRVVEAGTGVNLTLTDPNHLDAQRAWQGPLPRSERRFELPMAFEDGEWRIDEAPNALIVPETWFATRYQQVSLYFFDPTANILAPEPVFVPRGKQLASALTQALLLGPGAGLEKVVQTFIPDGLKVNLSVPISDDGIANIALKGDAGNLSPDTIELMMVQLAWTLRQDRTIEAITLSINGKTQPLPGGVSTYSVSNGAEYDPAGFQASPLLYGLRGGLLASGASATLEPVSGPMGADPLGLRSVGISLQAAKAAGVTVDGTSVLQAPVSGTEEGRVQTVFSGGSDLLPPAWDAGSRMWLVDRTSEGAVVSWVRDGVAHTVDVPEVSGQRVRSFVVSRDGTRFVAVVRGPAGDELLVSRIAHNHGGRVLWATPARQLAGEPASDLPMRDIAWRSPSVLAILSPFPGTTDLVQLRVASVDGSPAPVGSSTTVSAHLQSLAGSPAEDEPLLGIGKHWMINLSGSDRTPIPIPDGTGSITYVG